MDLLTFLYRLTCAAQMDRRTVAPRRDFLKRMITMGSVGWFGLSACNRVDPNVSQSKATLSPSHSSPLEIAKSKTLIPPLDRQQPSQIRTATFALG